MKSKHHPNLIAATEVARHIYCARALGYDRLHPHERDMSLMAQLRRWVLTPWKSGSLVILLVVLGLQVGIILTIFAFFTMLAFTTLILYLIQLWRLSTSTVTVYHGTQAKSSRKRLVAPEFGLVGRLDYLLEDQYLIPILTKGCPAPSGEPHHAHVMQVIAHCLLLAENRDKHPDYGVIRYSDGRTFEVDFDEESVEVLSQHMDEIESDRKLEGLPPRSHEDRRRCYACCHRQRCDQSLFG